MDRRAIFAFVIIGLIIIMYPYYMRLISPPTPPVGQERIDNQGASGGPTLDSIPGRDTLSIQKLPSNPAGINVLMPSDTSAQRDIIVDTGLYRAVLSTKGGTIKSWKLKKFEGFRDTWVELLPQNSADALGLSMDFKEGRVNVSSFTFSCETESLHLDAAHPAESVEMSLRLANNIRVRKEFLFHDGLYSCTMRIFIEGYGNSIPTREYELSWMPGLSSTEANIREDMRGTSIYACMGNEAVRYNFEGKNQVLDRTEDGVSRWIGIRTKYFLMAMIPVTQASNGIWVHGEKSRLTIEKKSQELKKFAVALRMPLDMNGSTDHTFEIYLGPQSFSVLNRYGVGLERCMDMGWKFIRPISRAILAFFVFIHGLIPNYGIVIVIFTIVLKVLFYPLTHKQLEATKKMQELQPQLAELKDKYKKDPQRLNKETMALYRKAGANPLGGCFPLLLQMPVFFALFSVFQNTIEFRRAGFLLWIKDLSVRDPYLILPIIMAVTMFIQQKMTMKDPKQASMVYLMPAIMFFFFMNFASGLVLYWTVFNILSILQQLWIQRSSQPGLKEVGSV